MYVACSTLCFGRLPLPQALRTIRDLHFHKIDVALHEAGPHLRPSEVAEDVCRAAQVLKAGLSLAVSALHLELQAENDAAFVRQLRAAGRLARLTGAPLLCLSAAPAGSDLEAEVERLTDLARVATTEGVLLTVETHRETLTADPAGAAELCRRVPGLGLTFDPSHYLATDHRPNFDALLPHVRHVRLRDTGKRPDQFQVRVGQGCVEYGRIITQLARCHYDRVLSIDIRDLPPPSYPMDQEVRKLKYLLESLI